MQIFIFPNHKAKFLTQHPANVFGKLYVRAFMNNPESPRIDKDGIPTMNCTKETMLLYAVTDQSWVGRQTFLQQVESALRGGITCLQLREKQLPEAVFLKEAQEVQALCRSYGVPLIINDNVTVALACGADGVHVGQQDLSARQVRAAVGNQMILGVSAQTVQQALTAQAAGANYLGVGAVFSTSTKLDAKPLPRQTLEEICRAVSIPVVAIGGITRENLPSLSGTGVAGVALVSAIFSAEDICQTCRELKALSQRMVNQ